jgi:hypothetical protein
VTTAGPVTVRTQAPESDDAYSNKILEVHALCREGKFDDAIRVLREMIREFADAENILRELYNEVVKTVHRKLNASQDPEAIVKLERERETQAREALRRYPGIKAGVGFTNVDVLYDELRSEMFGEIEITTSPDSCHVQIDGSDVGYSPYHKKYFPVGGHTVKVFLAGYEEKETGIEIAGGARGSWEISLEKIRGRSWWMTYVVAPAAIAGGVILAVVLTRDDKQQQPEEQEPLPDPPPPPAN